MGELHTNEMARPCQILEVMHRAITWTPIFILLIPTRMALLVARVAGELKTSKVGLVVDEEATCDFAALETNSQAEDVRSRTYL